MATDNELQKLGQDLHSTTFLLGGFRRKAAVKALAERRNEPAATALLVEGLQIAGISDLAAEALRDLKSAGAIDVLCAAATRGPQSLAGKLCLERQYRPADHEQACLFLFVTRQLEEYFKEDYEFQNLRLQYDRADEKLRALVMDVVRGGDRRCLPFITRPRKALHECTEEEIKPAPEFCLQHKDWNRFFLACLELPAKYSFPAWDRFRNSGWQPDDAVLASVYKQVLADSAGQTVEPPAPPQAVSGVVGTRLAEGRKAELASASESDLANRLKCPPPEGVPLVAALTAKAQRSAAAIQAVAQSEYWLVRLAGLSAALAVASASVSWASGGLPVAGGVSARAVSAAGLVTEEPQAGPGKSVTVGTTEELLEVLAKFSADHTSQIKTAVLLPGVYWLTPGSAKPDTNLWNEVFDGYELRLKGATNVRLVGKDPYHKPLIRVPSQYANVFHFSDCSAITLQDLDLAHAPLRGECIGAVLRFEDCREVAISQCSLEGSGTFGIETCRTKGLCVKNSEISNCTSGILSLDTTTNAVFDLCLFTKNQDSDLVRISASQGILFRSVEFVRNWGRGGPDWPCTVFWLMHSSDVRLEHCLLRQNQAQAFVNVRGALTLKGCKFEKNIFTRKYLPRPPKRRPSDEVE